MSVFEGLADHWWWLLAAALLGILEIFVPGHLPGLDGDRRRDHRPRRRLRCRLGLPYQLGLFALLAFIAVFAGRRYYERNPVESADPKLNERASRLIGQTVTVETAIQNGQGRVKVGDSSVARPRPRRAGGQPGRGRRRRRHRASTWSRRRLGEGSRRGQSLSRAERDDRVRRR